jgi:phosphoglycerol transferase
MHSWVLLIVATLALCASVAAAFFGRRSKLIAVVLGVLVFLFVVLAFMFVTANWFTGQGIDQATLYHVTYGLDGAGFSEYSLIILGGIALLVFGAAGALACTLTLTRTRPRELRLHSQRFSIPLAFLACAINPATKDLLELGGVELSGETSHESFEAYYRRPKLSAGPSTLRNFIFIYGEGLERTYFDEALFPGLIVGLRELEARSTTFTDIRQTTGTSFTIGGIVGSQCGIPLLTASPGNSMSGMSKFLPNAVCFGDLLSRRGYHLSFLGGASLKFAGKGKFLNGHGFADAQGREQLIEQLPDPTYLSGWGVHDDSLLDLAYDKLVELSSKPKPFGLMMLTLDTHHPDGHVARRVADAKYEGGKVSILNAVAGSDRLLTAFIHRVLDSPPGKDTVIVLASDHLALQNGATARLERGERRNLFMIIDPHNPAGSRIDKPGTTLDIGSTVLHALGFQTNIGLGRDLLADEPSLRAQLPNFHASLTSWKSPISGFWGFSQLEDVVIDAAAKTIHAGGTSVLAPALITFDEDLHADVYFEFNTQSKLTDYVYRLDIGKPFLWVVDCARANGYTPIEDTRASQLCVVSGRRGAEPLLRRPVEASLEIEEDLLERVLKTTADPVTHGNQSARMVRSQLPSGLDALTSSLPSGSVFLRPKKDRADKYVKAYAQLPDVAARGIRWATAIPKEPEFYFAAPSLGTVRKSRKYSVQQLALGDDLPTIVSRHSEDMVILSLKGDFQALSSETLERLAEAGVDLRQLNRAGSFAAVLDAHAPALVEMSNDAPVALASEALKARGIDRVESAGRSAGDRSKIVIRGKDISRNHRGINIVILPKSGSRSSLYIDTHNTERLPSDVYKATLATR